jgi:hypothetical protein
MAKSIVDYILEEDYARYNELLNIAEQNKANAPKAPRAPRAPMTHEQKVKRAEKKMLEAQAKLDALLAAMNG